LRGPDDDEERIAIFLDLGILMRLLGILDGERMQIELPLNPVQKLTAGLEEADPRDIARFLPPLAGLVHVDIGNTPALGINA
jgi:hypothetical protein